MIDTGGTIAQAADALLDQRRGRRRRRRHARRAVRPGHRPAEELRRHARSSSPTRCRSRTSKQFDKLTVLSIAPLLARAIHEVFEDGSVTSLFDGQS